MSNSWAVVGVGGVAILSCECELVPIITMCRGVVV